MALICIEGFDWANSYYESAMRYFRRKWSENGAVQGMVSSTGRFSGRSALPNLYDGPFFKAFFDTDTVVVGGAIKLYGSNTTTAQDPVWSYHNGTNLLAGVYLSTTANTPLYMALNGTALFTSTATITTGQWYYVETKYTIGSTGLVELYIDGVSQGSSTANTIVGTNTTMNRVYLGSYTYGQNKALHYLDDLYILDTSGTVNNDYLGDVRVSFNTATGSSTSQWNVSSGTASNASYVDDGSPDDDTTYVYSTTTGAVDVYPFVDVGTDTNIKVYAVQVSAMHRRDDTEAHTVAPLLVDGTTTYTGSVGTCGADYLCTTTLWETDPATSTLWTPATVNTLCSGVKLVS